jgi:GT2 family glycosyltransferase
MILSKDHVRKQIEFMDMNRNVAVAKAKCGTTNSTSILSSLEQMQYLAFDFRYDEKIESSVVGVGGSTYRVKAVRAVRGFDERIRRSGEDFDVEHRMRDMGWLIYRTPAIFYKGHCKTWKSAWYECVKYGYGGHYIIDKYREKVLKRSAASLLDGLMNAKTAYKLTRRKLSFLLPFHHALKRIAWLLGFLEAHISRKQAFDYSHSEAIEEPCIIYNK